MRAWLASLSFALLAGPAVAAPMPVVASFSILGDMVQQVGGDRVSVTTIVGPNADTHVYEPRPKDAAVLGEARAFFVNGLGFEGWIDRLVQATGFKGEVVTVSDGVTTRATGGESAHEGDHSHGFIDPHAWQSLGNGLIYVANIARGLCAVDAEGCATYTASAEAYSAQIAALDAEVKAQIAAVPEAERKVITTHDAFGYFAEAYGVTFLAPEGISTESEASATDVARLIDQVRHEGVKALFIENMSDPRLVQQIAAETGAKPGGALYADALSEPDAGAATYLDMFRHNVGLLVQALQGKQDSGN
jgi:zinc/manganese transport system substrate-binding protein